MSQPSPTSPSTGLDANPLLAPSGGDWSGEFGVPPFGEIAPDHFLPAFEHAFAAHMAEIDALASDPAAPSFANTIVALELSGRPLGRVGDVFYALTSAHSNDALLALEREIAPRMAQHWNRIHLNEALFRRIDALWRTRDRLGLDPEQARVLERYHTGFTRAGAALAAEAKKRLAEIGERLAALGTSFSQNVLADEQSYALALEEGDLAGLPDFVVAAARAAAEERGLKGKHVITLSRSSVEPFLQFSARRDLRERVFHAWIARGDGGGKTDNKAIIAEIVVLRIERARLLGYDTFAQYRLDDAMAKRPEAVRGLLEKVWRPARARAFADRDAMQELVREEGGNFALAAWDWRYYAEKLRKRRCDLDEGEIKPYLQLDNIIAAAFDTAQRLFGLTFKPLANVPVWHPDVRVWEVRNADGRHMGLFFGDYFARASKRSGAWMTTLRDQEKISRKRTNSNRHPEVRAERASKGDGHRKSAIADLRGEISLPISTKSEIGGRSSFEARPAGEHLRMTDQSDIIDTRPLVLNVCNFAKGAEGAPSLLSFDDARTLFHEFGHALHGLLSDVTYPRISGTSVLTDWVELPSQLYEHWLERPEVLRKFAVHYRTGKPMPEDLLRRLIAARTFNQGFATVEYVASALVDLEFHSLQSADRLDVAAFEKDALARIGMPAEIVMRHRSPHFAHVFSGGGYAAAYYSYMWSEVLDADAFAAFEETGDVFDAAMAKKLHDNIYAAGGKRDPEELYKAFRGRLPSADALLKKRGFVDATPAA